MWKISLKNMSWSLLQFDGRMLDGLARSGWMDR
jgi:hypothetical protein